MWCPRLDKWRGGVFTPLHSTQCMRLHCRNSFPPLKNLLLVIVACLHTLETIWQRSRCRRRLRRSCSWRMSRPSWANTKVRLHWGGGNIAQLKTHSHPLLLLFLALMLLQPTKKSQVTTVILKPRNIPFQTKTLELHDNVHVKVGRQTSSKTQPGPFNGYFDSKVLSRTHAEIWSEHGKVNITLFPWQLNRHLTQKNYL